jgi:hypothetical protein
MVRTPALSTSKSDEADANIHSIRYKKLGNGQDVLRGQLNSTPTGSGADRL